MAEVINGRVVLKDFTEVSASRERHDWFEESFQEILAHAEAVHDPHGHGCAFRWVGHCVVCGSRFIVKKQRKFKDLCQHHALVKASADFYGRLLH